mmetsp:Transcript_50351/g.129691  ORF Transcript_50351/g.129691 Transcript_50351/m.129691 type:complete len:90 (+) Transcript_50351:377-646(+)
MVAPEQHESVKKEDEDESQGAISAPVPVGEEVTIKQEIETCVTVAPLKKEAGPARSSCSILVPRRGAGEDGQGATGIPVVEVTRKEVET